MKLFDKIIGVIVALCKHVKYARAALEDDKY